MTFSGDMAGPMTDQNLEPIPVYEFKVHGLGVKSDPQRAESPEAHPAWVIA